MQYKGTEILAVWAFEKLQLGPFLLLIQDNPMNSYSTALVLEK
jgi:hypothetical protein